MAVLAPPTWRKPVGEGANRSFIGLPLVIGGRSYERPGKASRNGIPARRYNPQFAMPTQRARQSGFSLVEVLMAILILGVVITTSLFVYYERERRLRDAGEVMLVWQVLGNEAEALRHARWVTLAPGSSQPFLTDLALLDPLGSVLAEATIQEIDASTRRVVLRVSWRGGTREATAEVIRSDTGGDPLW